MNIKILKIPAIKMVLWRGSDKTNIDLFKIVYENPFRFLKSYTEKRISKNCFEKESIIIYEERHLWNRI